MRKTVIITSPSLDTKENVSGVSSVVNFIINSNKDYSYIHFLIGKRDNESGNAFIRIFKLLGRFFGWIRLLRQEKDAILHYSYPLEMKSIVRDWLFMSYAHLRNRQMLIHVHGGLYLTRKERPWFVSKILSQVFSWGHPIVVLSADEKKMLEEQFYARNITVLPNCISLDVAKEQRKTFVGKRHLHLLYLGRIEKNKGIDYIIEACQILRSEGVQYTLHVAGKEQEPYLQMIEAKLGDSFIYEGIVSGQEKDDLLKLCDVFVLPSFYEGLPVSLIECMSFGMIPICTNVGSISSVVEHDENGYLVPLFDSYSIAEAIKEIYYDNMKSEELSANAKQMIFDNFSPEKYVSALNVLYAI